MSEICPPVDMVAPSSDPRRAADARFMIRESMAEAIDVIAIQAETALNCLDAADDDGALRALTLAAAGFRHAGSLAMDMRKANADAKAFRQNRP